MLVQKTAFEKLVRALTMFVVIYIMLYYIYGTSSEPSIQKHVVGAAIVLGYYIMIEMYWPSVCVINDSNNDNDTTAVASQ